MGTERWVPLFPLELVLLPGALLPLHIFEERYRALTRRCLEEPCSFGILLVRSESLLPVGCEASIARVLERYDDGRVDLLTQGGRPFTLLELREHPEGYLEGRVEFLEDEAEDPEPEAKETLRRLVREYRRLVDEQEAAVEGTAATAEVDEPDRLGYTFPLAASIQMDLNERQSLLETRSERRREQMLIAHLARLVPVLRAGRENRRKIRGNGKPLPPS